MMILHRLLQQRAVAGQPVRVGLIGAGKFGSMYRAGHAERRRIARNHSS